MSIRLQVVVAVVVVGCAGNFTPKQTPCDGETCSGYGECVMIGELAWCECEELYKRVVLTCMADCIGVECSDRGGCVPVDNKHVCVCDQGYYGVGLECEEAPRICRGQDCTGHGVCVVQDGEAGCICEHGWVSFGLSCVPASCRGVNCSGRGACVEEEGVPRCLCDAQYEERSLGCVAKTCLLNDCSGHGACLEDAEGAYCICDYGYDAVGLSCIPERCEKEDCSGHGACVERDGEVRCVCDIGYVADGLSCRPGCVELDCSGHGACVQSGGELSCVCDPGYEVDGQRCVPAAGPGGDGGAEAGAEDGGAARDGSLDAGAASESVGAGDSGPDSGVVSDGGDSAVAADAEADRSLDGDRADGGLLGDSGDSGVASDGRDGSMPGDGGSSAVDGGRPEAPGEWVLIDVSRTPFMMGSPETELGRYTEEVQHEVTLTRNYWLMTTEITQQQFQDVMGYNPSNFSACGLNCPVEMVNWREVAAYTNELSVSEGLGECYDCSGTAPGTIACLASGSYATPYDCPGYRLPTEAEWEYAARGGTTTATYNGDLTTTDCELTPIVDPIAWYCNNAGGTTHPVGTKTPNAYVLYDMLGNVREWCHDLYGTYPPGSVTNPTGASSGSLRVLRGGSWIDFARNARAAIRYNNAAGDRDSNIGGRILRSGS